MSQAEETPKQTREPQANDDATADVADELEIVDAMKPGPATASNNKPLKYGTRKKKSGESGPVVQSIGSISAIEDEEEIEMDDLPVRANAPEELIDKRNNPSESSDDWGESRPRRQGRSRGERRERKPRERSPEPEAETGDAVAESSAPESQEQDQDRPDRFGTVQRSQPANQVQEFRPSRDGRTAPKRERRPKKEATSTVAKPKKKGLLAKIVSFFTGDEKTEGGQESPDHSKPRNRGGRRGPQNRKDRNSDGNGNRPRRRKPRNRKPRQDGESGGKPRGDGQGGNSTRRRKRRPRRQGQGNRDRQKSPASE